MKLSILICTVPSRVSDFLPKMINHLTKQATKGVEIIYLGDNRQRSVGQKRNDLLALAQGDYVTFVDDDDEVTDDYVVEILNAIRGKADVINFNLMCSVNGGEYKKVYYDASFRRDRDHPDRYERIPNHIMCVKRELALSVGFPLINVREDSDYAKRLRPLLRTQTFIEKVLYYYNFSHKISETQ